MKKKILILGSLSIFLILCISISLSANPMIESYTPHHQEEDDERESPWPCDNPDQLGIICLLGSIDCNPRDCPDPNNED